ncbi:MAG: hypothetical protein OQK72_08790, partial [Gammaproteobacteria bacterium]|nr:hypothetical protein [Gammaproteobacteria bacterium]
MSRRFQKSLIALSVSGLLISPLANATNGYFAHGYSTKEKGLAGAGVAHSQDAMAAANNPAGMVNVGNRLDVGAAIFNPNRSYTVSGSAAPPTGTSSAACFPACGFHLELGEVESEANVFLIPHVAYNTMLDSESSAGISIYGNGG